MPTTKTRKRKVEAIFITPRRAEIRIGGKLKQPLQAKKNWTNERFEEEVREVAHRHGDTVSVKK